MAKWKVYLMSIPGDFQVIKVSRGKPNIVDGVLAFLDRTETVACFGAGQWVYFEESVDGS